MFREIVNTMEDQINTKDLAISHNIRWSRLALILGWITLGIVIAQVGMPQAITGPLVNALLLAAVETAGIGPAVLVGLTTPLSALANGVLPLPLMVMIPFMEYLARANAARQQVYSALPQIQR